MNKNNEIGFYIKDILKKRGISQKYLAQKTNMPATTMSGYLNSKRAIPFDVVCNIAKELNLDLNKFSNVQSTYVMSEDEYSIISQIRILDSKKKKELYAHLIAFIKLCQS